MTPSTDPVDRASIAARLHGFPRREADRPELTNNARYTIRQVTTERALLRLPRIGGEIPVRLSRPLPSTPSSVTIIREADGRYYASFTVQVPGQ